MSYDGDGAATRSVLCVTPNASVDRTVVVPALAPGGVLRTDLTRAVAGGKGTNVARSLLSLGHPAVALGMAGGRTGGVAVALAREEGLDAHWIAIDGETRTCFVIVAADTGIATVISEVGPTIDEREWRSFANATYALANASAAVCVAGSLPPGIPAHVYRELISSLVAQHVLVYVDTNGPALVAAVAAGPAGVKVNGQEASQLVGYEVDTLADAAACAADIRAMGLHEAIVTVGRAGAALACDDGTAAIAAPSVPTLSAVGSGDAFLAGYVEGRVVGAGPFESLRRGVASGAANAQSPWGGAFERHQYEQALLQLEVRGEVGK